MSYGVRKGKDVYKSVKLDDFSDDDDDNFAANSAQRQQQLFAEQDAGLEMLGKSAEKLGKMSMAINEELGFQNKMLDEMESDLDDAAEEMDMVTRRTKEFIEMSGGTKNFMVILTLSAICIVLFFLLLYT